MDKPFLTFDQQIDKLINEYGLIITNREFAYTILSSVSYYDLINGYKFIFMPDDQTFVAETTIEHLYAFHIYNKNIQSIIFKYSTYAENSFKTVLSHVIAEHFGEHQSNYLNPFKYKKHENLEKRKAYREALNRLTNLCLECDDTPTSHYIEKKDHVPPWILFRNSTFSDTTELFQALKVKEKEHVVNQITMLFNSQLDFNNQVSALTSSLRVVRKFRNKIAHNLNFLTYRKAKLWKNANILFVDTLVLSGELEITFDNVWASILSTIIILNNPYLVRNFLTELRSYLEGPEEILVKYCEWAGIPLNFYERIENYLIRLKL